MSILVRVWGERALFTRPEMKTERVSYDVMTPSAARGLLEAILWHPGMQYSIDKIYVCRPIRFETLRRNEVKAVISARNVSTVMKQGAGELYMVTQNEIQQRASLLLRDVEYVIAAHFDMTNRAAPSDSPAKFQEMLKRRLRKGQFFTPPYFGCREFPAHFELCEEIPHCPEGLRGEQDLGYMLYDMDYSDPENIRPLFFRAKLKDGVLTVPPTHSEEVIG